MTSSNDSIASKSTTRSTGKRNGHGICNNLYINVKQSLRATIPAAALFRQETKFLVSGRWSANEQRCGLLQTLCAVSGARRVLEIGQFCGVAMLAIAEVVTLEIDPFLADFGKQATRRVAARTIER
ncbi:unnamed protein product [Polarella glacialis]|uniref:Uncharacterized protein n=1 Tax=Polarella glacialis TaxID=89957 RepID=A0A813K669_POLGL|nr:unnamed protein product [Polarella glacialis]